MIIVSMFDRAQDALPKPVCVNWEDLPAVLGPHAIVGASRADKEAARMFSPAEFAQGGGRSVRNALRVHFAMADLDELTAAQMIEAAGVFDGYATIFYTTHGDRAARVSKGLRKFRLGVKLTRAVEASEWAAWWPRFSGKLKGLCDPATKDISRCYFVPSVPDEAARQEAIFEVAAGAALDVDALLAENVPQAALAAPLARAVAIDTDMLKDLAWSLERKKTSPSLQETGRALRRALKKEPMTAPESHARDITYYAVLGQAVKRWPALDEKSLSDLLYPSVYNMHPGDPRGASDLYQKGFGMLSRLKADAQKSEELRQAKLKDAHSRRVRAASGGARSDPYCSADASGIAAINGTDIQTLRQRLILQKRDAYWFLTHEGYEGPHGSPDMVAQARQYLSLWKELDVTTTEVSERGALRDKTAADLVRDYGTALKCVGMDLSAQRSVFEEMKCGLIEAPCPLRPPAPERSPAVEVWLEELAGQSRVDKLLDWIQSVPDLGEPCCALYLHGDTGVGKSLLACGLARLWGDVQPTTLASVVSDFNEAVLHCPLVFGDEEVPKALREEGGTGWLREAIQGRGMELRRKYVPTVQVKGSMRFMFAANDTRLLSSREVITPEGAEALAGRLLNIHVRKEAGAMLAELQGMEGIDRIKRFVSGGEIAAHVMWLRANRKLSVRGLRFLVEGERQGEVHQALLMGNPAAAAVAQWCIGYLGHPHEIDSQGEMLARVRKGRLYVSVAALVKKWGVYMGHEPQPSGARLADALSAISEKGGRKMAGGNGSLSMYREIKQDALRTFACGRGFSTDEQLDAALARDTTINGKAIVDTPDNSEEPF